MAGDVLVKSGAIMCRIGIGKGDCIILYSDGVVWSCLAFVLVPINIVQVKLSCVALG